MTPALVVVGAERSRSMLDVDAIGAAALTGITNGLPLSPYFSFK